MSRLRKQVASLDAVMRGLRGKTSSSVPPVGTDTQWVHHGDAYGLSTGEFVAVVYSAGPAPLPMMHYGDAWCWRIARTTDGRQWDGTFGKDALVELSPTVGGCTDAGKREEKLVEAKARAREALYREAGRRRGTARSRAGPSAESVAAPAAPAHLVAWLSSREKRTVRSLREASRLMRHYIDQHGLGASDFSGGRVTDPAGNLVTRVSYNGRVWAPGEERAEIANLDWPCA